ncbi:MAG: hypothetical protein KAR39_05265 [Thermoplasmata archaeon]|nr:hypothetical protein [Thermoplasmata archaeon]
MKTRVYFMVYLMCAALLSFCVLSDYTVQAQTDWTKHPGNPLLVNGGFLEWDMAIMHPNVIQEPTGYKMWFTAQTLTPTFEPVFRIGLATASDEVTWTKDPSNPVMDAGSPGSWEQTGVAVPWVLPNVTGYKMWYSGLDSNFFPQIGYATSADGESWVKHPGNPVLTPGAPNEWDGNGTMGMSVLHLGGTYHAWYSGADLGGILKIGYATSPDGIAWTKYPNNPVLDAGAPGDWDSGGVGQPCVLFDGIRYRMWFMGSILDGLPDVGYAVSHDGINWTKHYDNPVLTKGSLGDWDEMMISGASVLQKPGGFDMWFGGLEWAMGSGIGYANSTLVPNRPPVLSGGSVSPDPGMANEAFTYRVTYQDEDNHPPIHVSVWINKSGVPVGSSPYKMNLDRWIDAKDNWSAGADFILSLNLSAEGIDYTFTFETSDGEETVFLGEQVGPTISIPFGSPELTGVWLSGISWPDVRMEWVASANDTGPGGIVKRYDIFHASSFDPTGNGYSVLASIPTSGQPSYSYEHLGAGEGDSSNYFYLICAVNAINATSCAEDQAGKYTRPLSEGVHLASVPLVQSNSGLESVLQTVRWEEAWSYDSSLQEWKWSVKSKPYTGELTNINSSMAVWIDVVARSNITVAGIVPKRTDVQLHAGWNLVGYPSFMQNCSAGDLKAIVTAETIEGYVPMAPYFLRRMSDGEPLQVGFGYWVKVTNEAVWTVVNS